MQSLIEARNNLVKLASAEGLGNAKNGSGRRFASYYLASTLGVVSSNIRRMITLLEAEAIQPGAHTARLRRRKNERGKAPSSNNERLPLPWWTLGDSNS